MSQSGKILVVGLGSAHGDDQAGWLVAEQLLKKVSVLKKVSGTFEASEGQVESLMRESSRHLFQHVDVRRAMIPLDVLDWLEGVSILHLCDACETTDSHEKLMRFTWNAGRLVHSDLPLAVGLGSFNRVPSGPREQRRAGWIPARGALPTRLNECAILNRGPYESTDFEVNAALTSLRGCGSHDFGLPDVLRLAETTGMLPKQVIIWAIEGSCFQPEDVMSDETRKTVRQVVDELMTELRMSHA